MDTDRILVHLFFGVVVTAVVVVVYFEFAASLAFVVSFASVASFAFAVVAAECSCDKSLDFGAGDTCAGWEDDELMGCGN